MHSSDIMSLHRYCRDRFIDFVPSIDVDGNVRVEDLMSLVPVVQKHLACFDNAFLFFDGVRSLHANFHVWLHSEVHSKLFPWVLYPLNAITMTASILMTVAIAIER